MANGQDGLHCYAGPSHISKQANMAHTTPAQQAPAAPATWLNVPCVPAKSWPTAEASPSVFEARLIIPQTAISPPFPSPTASTYVQGSSNNSNSQHSPVAQPMTPVQTPYVSEYRPLQNSPDPRGFPPTTFLRVISAPGMQQSSAPAASTGAERPDMEANSCRMRAAAPSYSILQQQHQQHQQHHQSVSTASPDQSHAGGLPWPNDLSTVSGSVAESAAADGRVNMMASSASRYVDNDVHDARRESPHAQTASLCVNNVTFRTDSHSHHPANQRRQHQHSGAGNEGRKPVQFVNYSTLMSPNSVLETNTARESDVHTTNGSRAPGSRGHDHGNQQQQPQHHHSQTLHHVSGDRGYQYSGYHTVSTYGSDNGSGGAGDARLLPVRVRRVKTKVLRQWMVDNKNHPYPSREDKEYLSSQCNMTVVQVSTWFANSRRRIQRIGLQGWVNDQVREDEKLSKDKQSTWN